MTYKIMLFGLTMMLFTSCDFYDNRLIIDNESLSNIYITVIKDTTLSLGENRTFIMDRYYIKSKEEKRVIRAGKKEWERLAEASIDRKLHIFILDEKNLLKYDAKEIVKKQLFKSRIDLSFEELSAINWKVVIKDKQ